MKSERKITFLRKQIEGYKTQIANLRNENQALLDENQELKRINTVNEDSIVSLNAEMSRIRNSFALRLNELSDVKRNYSQALSDLFVMKDKYTKEIEKLLKRLRQQK